MLVWENPLGALGLSGLIYALLASGNGSLLRVTGLHYYNYLADAFLHGQLHLRLIPNTVQDLILYNGHYYLYWPPLPALWLMPFVAVFGVQFSDILFTLLIAALNVGLVALILRQACAVYFIRLTRQQRGWLTMFFAIGTVHITLAPFGQVWFTGQITNFLCQAVAYWAVLKLRGPGAFALAGLGLAGALLTRSHTIMTALWPVYYLLHIHWSQPKLKLLAYSALGLAPLALSLGGLLTYNWARFGQPFEFGLNYHLMTDFFKETYQRYGPFNWHYLPTNLFYQYIAYPFPMRPETWLGGSLFLLSPVFLGAFGGLYTHRAQTDTWALVLTITCVNIPILLLMGTGWTQFGPRYTLDFTLPLLLLTAWGVRRWPLKWLIFFTLIASLHYIGGALLWIKTF